jgi:hypothetical protein
MLSNLDLVTESLTLKQGTKRDSGKRRRKKKGFKKEDKCELQKIGKNTKHTVLGHADQTVDTGGGFLGNTDEALGDVAPLGTVLLQDVADEFQNDLAFIILGRVGIGHLAGLFEFDFSLDTFVDQESGITTIIDNGVGSVYE